MNLCSTAWRSDYDTQRKDDQRGIAVIITTVFRCIARNRELQKGVFGRIIKDKETILELTDIVNMWIGR